MPADKRPLKVFLYLSPCATPIPLCGTSADTASYHYMAQVAQAVTPSRKGMICAGSWRSSSGATDATYRDHVRLKREGVDVWLDKEKPCGEPRRTILPGADREYEIRKAVREMYN